MPRDSKPDFGGRPDRIVFKTPEEKLRLEAENSIRLYDRVLELVRQSNGVFCITPSLLLEFHRLSIQGLYGCAGEWRISYIGLPGSNHVPPRWQDVLEYVNEMCNYANARQGIDQAIHTAAYLLWRLTWIHPFHGANGRTARAVSYYALSAAFGMELPGRPIIPELIDQNRDRYYSALEDADRQWDWERPDVRQMEDFLRELLERQFESATA